MAQGGRDPRDPRRPLVDLVRELAPHVSATASGERRVPSPTPPRAGPHRLGFPELGLPDPHRPDPPREPVDETYWGGYLELPEWLSPGRYPRLMRPPPDVNRADDDWVALEPPTHVGFCLYLWDAAQRLWNAYPQSADCLRGLLQLATYDGYPCPTVNFFFRSPYLSPELLREVMSRAVSVVCRYVGIDADEAQRAAPGHPPYLVHMHHSLDRYGAPDPRRFRPIPAPWIEERQLASGAEWTPWWAASNVYPWSDYALSRRLRQQLQRTIDRDPRTRLPRGVLARRALDDDDDAAAAAPPFDDDDDDLFFDPRPDSPDRPR